MSCSIGEKVKNAAARFARAICGDRQGLEKRVSKLEERLRDLQQSCKQAHNEPCSPVVIEQIFIEKIVVDKVEVNNNFASLGIKELSGALNIGANYGGGTLPPLEKKQGEASPPHNAKDKKQSQQGKGPKFSIDFK